MRTILKKQGGEQKSRKRILYGILEDKRVNELLKEGKPEKAEKEAMKIMEDLKVEEDPSSKETKK
jgi:siroheme synthase (precorrin-2 oxidase/ferrochelatase)